MSLLLSACPLQIWDAQRQFILLCDIPYRLCCTETLLLSLSYVFHGLLCGITYNGKASKLHCAIEREDCTANKRLKQ